MITGYADIITAKIETVYNRLDCITAIRDAWIKISGSCQGYNHARVVLDNLQVSGFKLTYRDYVILKQSIESNKSGKLLALGVLEDIEEISDYEVERRRKIKIAQQWYDTLPTQEQEYVDLLTRYYGPTA